MNGLPENLIKKLQRVQNTAARLVFNLRKYDRITPALVTLHWLPVKYRIEFKTLLIVFEGLHGKAPTYIQEMITPSKSKRYSIRSNEERLLKAPKFKHDTFGKRAFAVYGPLAWNCLPKEIRLCDEIEAFKRNLKTHLFVKFVNESTLAIWFWRIIVKRTRMLSAQFVALYKLCKPKPTWICFNMMPLIMFTIGTRTIRTPAFWGYPPPPHDYPYHWIILDPKSKEDKVKVTNLKNSPKFQIFEFWNGHYTLSEVAW